MSEQSTAQYSTLQSGVESLKTLYDKGLISDTNYTSGISSLEASYYNNTLTADNCATIVHNNSIITANSALTALGISSTDALAASVADTVSTSDTAADSSASTSPTSAASTAVGTDSISPSTMVNGKAVGAAFQNNYSTAWDATVDNYIGNYSGKGGRLTQFVHNSGTDADRLGYIKLDMPDTAMAAISSNSSADKAKLDAIYSLLSSANKKYDRFIINSVAENRSERLATMKTVGDSFSVTFSGREPMVISVSGALIFDYDRDRMSWYTAFCNAYENYLRASVTAKYRAKIKFVLPDFTIYEGYIISLTSNQSSDNDMVVPFNFSMLITQEAFNQAYNADGTVVTSATNASEYTAAKAAADKEISVTGDVSPVTDGELAYAESMLTDTGGTISATGDPIVLTQGTGVDKKVVSTVSNNTAKAVANQATLSANIRNARNTVNRVYTSVGSVLSAVGIRVSKNSILR